MFHFMETHEWLEKYNAILLSVSAYHNLTTINKSHAKVSQWNGKVTKAIHRYLV